MSSERVAPVEGTTPEPGASGLVPSQQITNYLRALRRRWWIVAWATAVAGLSAYAISATSPKKYDAAAKLTVDNTQPADVILQTPGTRSLDPEADIATDVALVRIETIARRVKADLGLSWTPLQLLSEVSAARQGNSNVIVITARDRSPKRAAAIANAFANEYVNFRRAKARAVYNRTAQQVQEQINSLTPQQRNGTAGRSLFDQLFKIRNAATLQTGGLQEADRATVPSAPSTPRPKMATAIGAILGLLVGSFLAIVLEFADRRLRDEEDVERLVQLPVLAKVNNGKRSLAPGSYDRRLQEEAFATLAVNLRYLALGADLRTIMVASTTAGDGKTSVTLGVGKALAAMGQRVIAIEGDVRRPMFANYLGIPPGGGLASVIEGLSSLTDEIVEIDLATGAPRRDEISFETAPEGSFAVLPAGRVAPDPHRVLSSDHMREVIAEARARADVVLVDTPALEVVSDALGLGGVVDTSIIVIRLNASTREGTRRTLRELAKVDIDTAGIVITGAPSSQLSYYLSDEPERTSTRKRSPSWGRSTISRLTSRR